MSLHPLFARVVVVEDIKPVRTLFERTILRIAPDAEVCHAADGTQALRAIEAAASEGLPFTLCISDIHMPNMSGIELVNTTRSHLGDDAPAFLLASARVTDAIKAQAQALGVALLDKPFGVDALRHAAQKVAGDDVAPAAAKPAVPPAPWSA